jgi:hypothetical protein
MAEWENKLFKKQSNRYVAIAVDRYFIYVVKKSVDLWFNVIKQLRLFSIHSY